MGNWDKWSIHDERRYLDGLGTWTGNQRRSIMSRADLLRSYIDTLPLRRYEPWLEDAWYYAQTLLAEEA